jgi:hypothetical protein
MAAAVLQVPPPSRTPGATRRISVKVVSPPADYTPYFARVVLAERLREVRALIGFTRIDSPAEFGDAPVIDPGRRSPISRTPPQWLPAA